MAEARADALEQAKHRASAAKLHTALAWRALMHYRPGSIDVVSLVDSESFFVDPNGKLDSRAELMATLEGIFRRPADNAEDGGHTQCRFPARTRWLLEALEIPTATAPQPACAAYKKWRGAMNPSRVVLVFASAFINAPPSMFGHTMLRVDNRDAPDDPLLATLINFAGYPHSDNPFAYAFDGLTGGFPGRFATGPYYVKVQEYTNIQARDLWEYELRLSDDQIERMLEHTWELLPAEFDYFFADENCAYHILALLDVADPSLGLMEEFGSVVIPVDTLRAVEPIQGSSKESSSSSSTSASGPAAASPSAVRRARRSKSEPSRAARRARRRRAVAVALAFAAALVFASSLLARRADVRDARRQLDQLSAELESYAAATGGYPLTLKALGWRLPGIVGGTEPLDPWGRRWLYRAPGSDGRPFDLGSAGPNGAVDPFEDTAADDVGRAFLAEPEALAN